jgi:acylphosphatase
MAPAALTDAVPDAASLRRPARLDASVRGRVQGVGFRYFVRGEAARLGIKGWVANQADGSVRCVAEGPRTSLEALLVSLREGPPGAVVRDVSTTWSEPTGEFDAFGVRSAGHRGD